MADFVELNNEEVFAIYTAVQALRRGARNIDFAQFTLEDAVNEARIFIGGEGSERPDNVPLGQLDKLDVLEKLVTEAVAAARERAEKAGESESQ